MGIMGQYIAKTYSDTKKETTLYYFRIKYRHIENTLKITYVYIAL